MQGRMPEPIEGGAIPQVLVEYDGGYIASVSFRGQVSGKRYRFANGPDARLKWILAEDEELFSRHRDFIVHEDHRIDPVRDRARALENRVASLQRTVETLQASAPVEIHPRPKAKGGRPRIPEEILLEAWHLHHHCEWRLGEVADYFKVQGDHPEAVMGQRLRRLKLEGNPPSDEECPLCEARPCPPRPEKSNKTS